VDNRFYLLALGITGIFVAVLILIWIASGGQAASEAEIRNADNTRTAIAMTGSYLLQPRTRTPGPVFTTPTSVTQTNVPGSTPTLPAMPSATNTSLLSQFNTPISPVAPSLTPLPTQTAVAQIAVSPTIGSPGQIGTRVPPLLPHSGTQSAGQGPAEFARWYFTRVWNERDYQNLWDHYLTASYKANVGSGLFEDYVGWWDSVERVDVNSVDVLANNGSDAYVRVNVTFRMKDGRVVANQAYDYDFLYDPSRGTWMFDATP
jgi:hypothetical protein